MAEPEIELQDNSPGGLATYWKQVIADSDRKHKEFRDFAEKAEATYRAENSGSEATAGKQRYNIFWSNVAIQMGALYGEKGTPEVRRRHKDTLGPQKDAAMVLERGIDFCLDTDDFDSHVRRAEKDWLVVGLGQARVLYDAKIGQRSETFAQMDDFGNVMQETIEWEEIEAQLCRVDFISWRHFHWDHCRSWDLCEWVAYDFYKSKKSVMEEYGVEGEESDEDDNGEKAIKITEIWHKPTRKIIVIGEQFKSPLEIREDSLGLQGFFNCPKPMVVNLKSDEFQPMADFWFYRWQADQLNKATTRIDNLIGSLKDQGFYDAAFTELSSVQNKDDGAYVPVEGLAERMGGGSMNQVMYQRPIDNTMTVIRELQGFIEQKKQEIYEITGLSDIVRGASVASETATAQGIKSQFASVRIRDKQQVIAYFVRDIFRIMGEIIGEHFEADVLSKMTGVEVTPEIEMILRDDVMRTFSIDIETNSTIAMDEQEELNNRMNALGTFSEFAQGILPAMQSGALPMEIGREMLLMSVRGQKHAGNLEDMIAQMGQEGPQQMVEQLQQQIAQMGQEMEGMQAELAKYDELDGYKKEADIRKTNAEADLKLAETKEQEIENAGNTVSLITRGTTPYAIG